MKKQALIIALALGGISTLPQIATAKTPYDQIIVPGGPAMFANTIRNQQLALKGEMSAPSSEDDLLGINPGPSGPLPTPSSAIDSAPFGLGSGVVLPTFYKVSGQLLGPNPNGKIVPIVVKGVTYQYQYTGCVMPLESWQCTAVPVTTPSQKQSLNGLSANSFNNVNLGLGGTSPGPAGNTVSYATKSYAPATNFSRGTQYGINYYSK